MASLHPVLDVDDDLLFMMRWATQELVKAGDTVRNHMQPLTKPRPRENRLPIASPNTKQLSQEMYARLKTIRKLRNSRELAGTPILPVAHHKQQLLGLIKDHTYSIIVAETGSGKSTQVPQIIVDDAIENHAGLDCRVMCVQPRRIAAQSLAYRVADERAEPVGRSVGYNVRFDRKSPVFDGGGTITYCTTGIFLNLLQDSSARLQSLSHIILDEVHVRDVGIDLVMLLLKRYVEKRQATGAPVPKIIVMSATVDVDLFSSYFRNKALDGTLIPAPHLTIAGRSFEVKKHYLEELLTTLEEFYSNKDLRLFFEQDMTRDYLANHAKQFGGEGSNESETQDSLAENGGSSASLADLDPYDEDRLMPYGLICATLFYLLSKTKDGSMLVFLPGLNHIFALEQDLQTYGELMGIDLSNETRYRVVKLHSSLQEEQQKLSLEVPDGCRRIILSTDIAEASLTIPDVRYVIDAGKVNEMIFDSKASSHRMACCWVSRSSALQRAGRAGRVQPGEYFFLGTKQRFDTLRITKSPEIVRSDLRETCLRTRKASPEESLSAILRRAIEPPEDTKVRIATESLKRLKALDQHENITSLGSILCQLSINPALGKLIILGVIFRCLDPLLILGSMSDGTSLFRRAVSVEDRQVIAECVRAFAGESSSDQIGYINAFKAVRDVWHGESPRMAWQYAIQHNIYFPSYRQMSIAARHMLHVLARAKLIKRWQATKIDYQHRFGGAELNTNSHHVPLIKALLLHCLFPQIAIPVVQSRYYTQTDPAALMGMTSVNNPKVSKSSLTLFNRKQSFPDNLPMLFDTSNITPLIACLFGGNLERNDKFLASGSWLKVGINSRKVELGGEGDDAITNVIELYNAIDDALEAAFESLASGRNSFLSYGEKVALYHSRNALFATLHRTLRDVLDRDLNRIPTISAHADKWDDYASVLQNSSS
ncbi:hypothetical protein NUU61_005579 [Penicillium alfredii]|uniref:P-loop containing nucleoside triphosphate hydrolase protein n=1 Tax=Penicillium alfredii TaxID=1506179 RepID=A0A9W9K7T1_9EURO|nr:uncharacterized protein NUU61_005579 [Penicillium alfredii]KAJ5096223.1 hypothetical protein NUU61_005579 [Penicillium alfredii]